MTTAELTTGPEMLEPVRTSTPSNSRRAVGAWALLAVGLVCWIVALSRADLSQLGPWGLLPVFSATWYIAAAIAAAVFLFALLTGGRPPRGILPASLAFMLLILYGTTSFIEGAPRFAWTYKHLGVTNYILQHGSVDTSVDIYQRWPGAFALGAYFGKLLGISDPTQFADWAQLFYAVVLAVLVFALARTLTVNVRSAWVAAAVFSVVNWSGQLYYAPQPLALCMHLGMLLIILHLLRSGPNRLGRWVEGLIRAKDGAIEPSRLPRPSVAVRWAAIGAVLLLHLVSTITHQLTPFLTIGLVVALAVLGYVRSKVLVVGVVVITAGYVLPNLAFINRNYGGLFHSLNPFKNFNTAPQVSTPRLGSKVFIGQLAPALAVIIGVLALIGILIRWRRGGRGPAVLCVVGIAVPLLLAFVQNYGGEAQSRAFLFALPWLGIAIGWLSVPSASAAQKSLIMRRLATVSAAAVILAMFITNFFGNEDLNYMPKDEVQASCQWLSANSPAGSVYVQSVTNFPSRCTGDYGSHLNATGNDSANLLTKQPKLAYNTFTTNVDRSIRTVYDDVISFGKDSRLIFSTSQMRYARDYTVFGGQDGYLRLEAGIASSPRFKLVFKNADTRIYAPVV